VTFHHVPRDEDEDSMHPHWSGFNLIPRDWTAKSYN
jgi:primary-amine oxidase